MMRNHRRPRRQRPSLTTIPLVFNNFHFFSLLRSHPFLPYTHFFHRASMPLFVSKDDNLHFHHNFPCPLISLYYLFVHDLWIWVSFCFILVSFTFILFNFYSIDLWMWARILFTWTCVWNIYFIWILLIRVVASYWALCIIDLGYWNLFILGVVVIGLYFGIIYEDEKRQRGIVCWLGAVRAFEDRAWFRIERRLVFWFEIKRGRTNLGGNSLGISYEFILFYFRKVRCFGGIS